MGSTKGHKIFVHEVQEVHKEEIHTSYFLVHLVDNPLRVLGGWCGSKLPMNPPLRTVAAWRSCAPSAEEARHSSQGAGSVTGKGVDNETRVAENVECLGREKSGYLLLTHSINRLSLVN